MRLHKSLHQTFAHLSFLNHVSLKVEVQSFEIDQINYPFNLLQRRPTITPSNFLDVGCYNYNIKFVFDTLFHDFSSVRCYSRSLARPNKGKLGVIAGHRRAL